MLKKRKRGYTLIELVVCLAIVGIVMVPTVSAVLSNNASVQQLSDHAPLYNVSNALAEKARQGLLVANGDVFEALGYTVGDNLTYRYTVVDADFFEIGVSGRGGFEAVYSYVQ